MKVGIFPVPPGFGIVFGLVLWIDLLIGLGGWGGASLCACCKAGNVE